MDCDQHKSLCGQYGVQGFPTIKVFSSNKNKPEDYQGQRDAQGIIAAAQNAAKKLVTERMGGKSSGGGKSGGKQAKTNDLSRNFNLSVTITTNYLRAGLLSVRCWDLNQL